MRRRRYFIILPALIHILTAAPRPIEASEGLLYREVNLIGGYSHDEGWLNKTEHLRNSLGIEYFKKFSNEYGDYLTSNFQGRLTYDFSERAKDAWGIEIHNAWLEYQLSLGNKLRVGHFSPAFGLESVMDTHGTLLQTLAMMNVGFKHDWGMAYRSLLGNFDYEVAAQLGYGMAIRDYDDSYLLSGRMGVPPTRDFQYGFSLLYGRVIESTGMALIPRPDIRAVVLKKRMGVDAQYHLAPYTFKGEVTFGEDDENTVSSLFIQSDYAPPAVQPLAFQFQWKYWIDDIERSDAYTMIWAAGLSYEVSASVTLRAAYTYRFDAMAENKDNQVFFQFYYFGL